MFQKFHIHSTTATKGFPYLLIFWHENMGPFLATPVKRVCALMAWIGLGLMDKVSLGLGYKNDQKWSLKVTYFQVRTHQT